MTSQCDRDQEVDSWCFSRGQGKGRPSAVRSVCQALLNASSTYLLLLLLLALEPGRKGLLILAELLCRGPSLPGSLLTAALSHGSRSYGRLF